VLTALAIRDVVLIERLDLSFNHGLTVLTGETGAGKSILLDSLGLALGARADSGLVRASADQASVTACFVPSEGHAVSAILDEHGLMSDDEVVLRRIVTKDGRSRAFINDHPVGVGLLRRIGGMLVEVQGQHEQMSLADQAGHAALLDAFGVAPPLRHAVAQAWRESREATEALETARAAIAAAERDEEYLRFAVDELATLAPRPNEEETLARERQRLQQQERRAEAIAVALAELTPRDRRNVGPSAALRAASRALQRLAPPGQLTAASPPNPADHALAALERAEEALAEAETILTRLAAEADVDPRLLEQSEERLFALRAAARKHGIAVPDLPALLDALAARLSALETGAAHIVELEQRARGAKACYLTAAEALTSARALAAGKLQKAVARELPPLRLDKARFLAEISPLPETGWGPGGMDQVRFLIAANPGQEPGPLSRVASGGELSRLMLAMKVVLSAGSPVPTLVFDEVDSGVGGATAAAVGERLVRVAEQVQVLVVTHSPQVAARGAAHLRVTKAVARGRATTAVELLDTTARREEIARMLAGETITPSARAAADDLLGQKPPQGLLV
jgi:DNA repair protein RecN (Recombination protein N)